jgi:selenide,water dikinase
MTSCHIVLVGAGHAHVEVLRSFGRRPEPGVRLTLITQHALTPYSGMLPGYVAGHYGADELYIAVEPLARLAQCRLLLAEATGLDPDGRTVRLRDGGEVAFDLLSVDTGAETRVPQGAGTGLDAIPVKPIDRFALRWSALAERIDRGDALRIAVVGGGAAGVELALAIRHRTARAGAAIALVERAGRPLPGLTPRAGRAAARLLRQRGIELAAGLDDRGRFDMVVWTTGVRPAGWLARSGLAADADGFAAIGPTLRSASHPEIFLAGDAAALIDRPQPKAGVVAVRQGPVLAENLRRAASGRALLPFVPRQAWLSLISTGDRHAIAVRGRWSAEGRWAWWWKDWIDRRFMRRYRIDPSRLQP